jgi:hypothetical protein
VVVVAPADHRGSIIDDILRITDQAYFLGAFDRFRTACSIYHIGACSIYHIAACSIYHISNCFRAALSDRFRTVFSDHIAACSIYHISDLFRAAFSDHHSTYGRGRGHSMLRRFSLVLRCRSRPRRVSER